MLDKIKEKMKYLNERGFPIPLLRDPKTDMGSVTLTLLFISSNVVLVSLLNSFANIFKGVDTSNSISFFVICLGGYLGRRLQYKNIVIEKSNDIKEK
jgi:hypothetical protein